jgi:biopolymer transport protein ExbB
MWGELASSFASGNLYVISIFVLGFIAAVIMFERLIVLQFSFNINFGKFLTNFRKAVGAEDLERAMSLCKSTSKSSLPKIALRALETAETDPSKVRGTIEEETIEFLPRVESRLGILPALATLILLVGILGTIDGVWAAFHSVDVLDTAKKQATLAKGVAASLNPTAMGLLMCMMILFAHQILRGMALRLVERIQHGVAVVSNLLVPPETAMYVAAGPAEAPAPSENMAAAPAAAAPSEPKAQGAADDSFDDASVEDIKDEEEII